jgi:dTDP-4-amino-4,6-dideoxygalactose transaminase
VLLDVDPETLNLSAEALQAAIDSTEGLDAVIGVHFGGTPLDERIHQICAEAGVALIEDAAHALGTVDHRGRVAGRGSAGACFSFYATKNLTSAEGGALVTDDAELARFAQSFRLHGLSRDAWARYTPGARTGTYDIVGDGLKANLPDVLAAIARVQLRRFDSLQRRRAEMDLTYRNRLRNVEGLRIVPSEPHPGTSHHLMVVLLPRGVDRDAVQQRLAVQRIGTSIHFRPLNSFEWFAEQGLRAGPTGTPNADAVANRALSLPFHTRLTDAHIERVCDVVQGAVTGIDRVA